ncbi:MAG TPA: HAD family hydrolase [Gaiellaceae bacterium]|nr:HAD family hydrolase [Gaiellaceae bacterium]
MRFRAVVFDLWQTLVPWRAESALALYGEMADAVGAPREEFVEAWLSNRGRRDTGSLAQSVRVVFDELGLDADPEVLLTMRRSWTRRALVPRPGALETLAELRRRGHLLGLITVCSEDVSQQWDSSVFGGTFDAPVFSCDVGVAKPDPRIYELCCRRLGIRPAEALFVGDGATYELPGAERVGMTAVQLRVPGEELTEPGKEWRGATIVSLERVLELS